jgi:hypothetical protein
LERRAAKSLELERAPLGAVHPPDLEDDAIDAETAHRATGEALEWLDAGAPTAGDSGG